MTKTRADNTAANLGTLNARVARVARPLVWRNANGTFSHHRDAGCEWADESSCCTDLRFHQEWRARADGGFACPIGYPGCVRNCGSYGCGN